MSQPSIKMVFQVIDAVLKSSPAKLQGYEGVYQFNITGEDSGTYQIIVDEHGGKAIEGTEADAECTLGLNAEDYKDLVRGELNPTEAFMSGKLQLDGDIGLALKLQNMLAELSPSI